jgi:hypothetical protein
VVGPAPRAAYGHKAACQVQPSEWHLIPRPLASRQVHSDAGPYVAEIATTERQCAGLLAEVVCQRRRDAFRGACRAALAPEQLAAVAFEPSARRVDADRWEELPAAPLRHQEPLPPDAEPSQAAPPRRLEPLGALQLLDAVPWGLPVAALRQGLRAVVRRVPLPALADQPDAERLRDALRSAQPQRALEELPPDGRARRQAAQRLAEPELPE